MDEESKGGKSMSLPNIPDITPINRELVSSNNRSAESILRYEE